MVAPRNVVYLLYYLKVVEMKHQMMEEMAEARKKKAAVAEAAKREEQRVSGRGRDLLVRFTLAVLPALIPDL